MMVVKMLFGRWLRWRHLLVALFFLIVFGTLCIVSEFLIFSDGEMSVFFFQEELSVSHQEQENITDHDNITLQKSMGVAPNCTALEAGTVPKRDGFNISHCERVLLPQIVEYKERLKNVTKVGFDCGKKCLLQSLQKHVAVTLGTDWEKTFFIPFHNFNYPSFPIRDISEAVPWLLFIVEHYHSLAKYVHFLHGHENSWHTVPEMQHFLVNSEPITSFVYSQQPPIFDVTNVTLLNEKEYVGIDFLVRTMFRNKTVQDIYTDLEMRWWGCCGEIVVSREAIQSKPLRFYIELLDYFLNNLGVAWGYVMERSWSMLFFALDGLTPNYLGCVLDDPKNPMLKLKKSSIDGETPCSLLCKGYPYSGLKGDGECFCSNNIDAERIKFSKKCYPCRKSGPNRGLVCGEGENNLAIFKTIKYDEKYLKF